MMRGLRSYVSAPPTTVDARPAQSGARQSLVIFWRFLQRIFPGKSGSICVHSDLGDHTQRISPALKAFGAVSPCKLYARVCTAGNRFLLLPAITAGRTEHV